MHTALVIGVTQLAFGTPGYHGAFNEEPGGQAFSSKKECRTSVTIFSFAVLSILLGVMELGWSIYTFAAGGGIGVAVVLLILAFVQVSRIRW